MSPIFRYPSSCKPPWIFLYKQYLILPPLPFLPFSFFHLSFCHLSVSVHQPWPLSLICSCPAVKKKKPLCWCCLQEFIFQGWCQRTTTTRGVLEMKYGEKGHEIEGQTEGTCLCEFVCELWWGFWVNCRGRRSCSNLLPECYIKAHWQGYVSSSVPFLFQEQRRILMLNLIPDTWGREQFCSIPGHCSPWYCEAVLSCVLLSVTYSQ